MKKLLFLSLALCLAATLGMAQDVNEKSPMQNTGLTAAAKAMGPRALGDTLWYMDVEAITGDIRVLGCEFDGTNYWFTGAYDFTIANLYEIAPDGTLVNTYPQPTTNWGAWGWRDLAYDGQYLYAGDDTTKPGYITQIDPSNGQPTGVNYGPTGITPCRALAYDPAEDCFYTASFSSALKKVYRDNSSVTVLSTTGYSTYGAAVADSMLWLWNQNGNGLLATEFDMGAGAFTGVFFDGDQSVGGGASIAGGACCYDNGTSWEFLGQGQGTPDVAVAYEIPYYGPGDPLKISPSTLLGIHGGNVHFSLNAGVDNGGEFFGIFGTGSGTEPGTDLPGGLVLPINWDNYTDTFLALAGAGNPNFPLFGFLDADGKAEVDMYLARKVRYFDLTLNFAFTVEEYDFVSNSVELFVEGEEVPVPEYKYDDGSTENSLGLTAGGHICWAQWFQVQAGNDTITGIKTAYGSLMWPTTIPNGQAAYVYLWDDPTNDGDPSDCVLLTSMATTVQNINTDMLNLVDIADTVVSGIFFIGASTDQAAGQYPAPMDQSQNPTGGQGWVIGSTTYSFDASNLMNNDVPPTQLQPIGLDAYLLLRATY